MERVAGLLVTITLSLVCPSARRIPDFKTTTIAQNPSMIFRGPCAIDSSHMVHKPNFSDYKIHPVEVFQVLLQTEYNVYSFEREFQFMKKVQFSIRPCVHEKTSTTWRA